MRLPHASALLVASLVLTAPGVRAMPPEVHRALQALKNYEPQDVEVLEVLRALEENRGAPSADRREAAFLRTAVSADLWLLAEFDGRNGLRERLARHWKRDAEATLELLVSRLQRFAFGIYAAPARDARAALLHLVGGRPFEAPPQGDRTGLLYVRAVLEAAQGPEPLEALSALAPDPCAQPEAGGCTELERRFEVRGRRAAAALRAAGGHLLRARRAAEGADPLVSALANRIAAWRDALRRLDLRPAPRLPDTLHVPVRSATEPWGDVDVVLFVEQDALHLAEPPRLGFDGRGPALRTSILPALPHFERLALPRRHRPAIRPLPEVVDRLLPLVRGGTSGLAFSVAEDVPAHLLARVLRSAEAAGFERLALLARDASGGRARIVPVELMRGIDAVRAGTDARDLFVRVRLGGFTLRAGRRVQDVPRIREGERLHFDVPTLVALSRQRPYQRAIVGYMSSVPSAVVLDALAGLHAPQRPVALLLP